MLLVRDAVDEDLAMAANALNSRYHEQTGIEVLVQRRWRGLTVVQGLWAVDNWTDVFQPVRQRWIWNYAWRPKQPAHVAANNIGLFFSQRPDLPPDERPPSGRAPDR